MKRGAARAADLGDVGDECPVIGCESPSKTRLFTRLT
jgi:hypothetical protein